MRQSVKRVDIRERLKNNILKSKCIFVIYSHTLLNFIIVVIVVYFDFQRVSLVDLNKEGGSGMGCVLMNYK